METGKDRILTKMSTHQITTGDVAQECSCQSSFIGKFLTEGVDDMDKRVEAFWVKRIEAAIDTLITKKSTRSRSVEMPGVKFDENKQDICNALCKALQKTRAGRGIISLTYKEGDEIVTLISVNGVMNIDVACDSGIAMIHDILRQLD